MLCTFARITSRIGNLYCWKQNKPHLVEPLLPAILCMYKNYVQIICTYDVYTQSIQKSKRTTNIGLLHTEIAKYQNNCVVSTVFQQNYSANNIILAKYLTRSAVFCWWFMFSVRWESAGWRSSVYICRKEKTTRLAASFDLIDWTCTRTMLAMQY